MCDMTEKRFTANLTHYGTSRNYVEGIKDNQSNTELKSIIEIIDLLNAQHDALIKKDELLTKVLKVNDNYEKCLKEIDDVLSKHNIHTLEKLDQVLTNERTW